MKKILSILLVATFAIAMAACSSASGSASSKSSSAAVASGSTAEEVKWPSKTVELVLTAKAGGDTDFNARTFATSFEKYTGVPMIITNEAGSSGAIAMDDVKNRKPDGGSALFCHTGQLVINKINGNLDYDQDAFAVSCIPAVNSAYVLVAGQKSGIASVSDLIEKAKANPSTVIYGTEMGGYTHLQALQLQQIAGIELKIVDAGSASDKVTGLLNGSFDVAAIPYSSAADYQTTGQMVVLAQYGEEANTLLPAEIPTLKSEGVDLVDVIPYIISFPEGTDPAIVNKMSDVAEQVAADPEYQAQIRDAYAQEPTVYAHDDAIAYLDEVRSRYQGYADLLNG